MGKGAKFHYTWVDYDKDIKSIINIIKERNIQLAGIICIYRGSLTIGTSLSNMLGLPLSIIKFQTRDGGDNNPEFILDLRKKERDGTYLIVDDIIDSGLTMRKILEKLESEQRDVDTEKYITCGLYGYMGYEHDQDDKEIVLKQVPGWVVFPWENINTTFCKECGYGEICCKDSENKTHCNIINKSFLNEHTCNFGMVNVPVITKGTKDPFIDYDKTNRKDKLDC